jgi:hypothetical protein
MLGMLLRLSYMQGRQEVAIRGLILGEADFARHRKGRRNRRHEKYPNAHRFCPIRPRLLYPADKETLGSGSGQTITKDGVG